MIAYLKRGFSSSLKPSQPQKPLKVIALHGKGGNGDIFKERLSPLITVSSMHEWIFPTAFHRLDQSSPTQVAGWWLLKPGVRSFEADEYIGIETSIAQIESLIESTKADVLLGHSQGAMLASIILARRLTGQSAVHMPSGAILSGAAWPRPFGHLLESLRSSPAMTNSHLVSIHTLGKFDNINPPSQSLEIAKCFAAVTANQSDVLIHHHDGGHVLPQDTDSIARYLHLFQQCQNASRGYE